MPTIDERVVEMRFDNKDFEKNVQTSLKTIDKLKDSLDFEGATNSLEDLQDAAKHFTLDDIGNALQDLSDKFNWENIFKIGLLGKALDFVTGQIHKAFSAVNNALMLDQADWVQNMTIGWNKYAEKTNSVATIMAATGDSLETVNTQMEKLMFFTDETSYNFTDMASNIGKFTANGVSLEDSVAAMEGIANWAARSGQEAGAASRVMYNLSQAIGMGSLKLQDWKSVELANMGTKEFKEVAIQAGLVSGTLKQVGNDIITVAKGTKVTVDNFRETLKDEWLDTPTLISVLNEYGKASDLIAKINSATGMWTMDMEDFIRSFRTGAYSLSDFKDALVESGYDISTFNTSVAELYEQFKLLSSAEYEFSLETYKAGQEARTFEAAMKSVSDAVSSGWMRTFELIFGQYEEAKVLWSDLAENLFTIFRSGIDDRNRRLSSASVDGWEHLSALINEAGYSLDEFEEALVKHGGLDERRIDELAGSYESLTDAILDGAVGAERGIQMLKNAIDSLGGTSETVSETANTLGLSYEELEKYGEEVRSGIYGWYTSEEQVQRIMAANSNLTKEQAEMIVKYAEAQHEVHRGLTEDEYRQWLALQNILETQNELVEGSDEWKDALKEAADEVYRKGFRKSFLEGLINSGHILAEVVTQVRSVIKELIPPVTSERLYELAVGFKNTTERIRTFVENSEFVKNIVALFVGPLGVILQIGTGLLKVIVSLGRVLGLLLSPVLALLSVIGWIIRQVNQLTGGFNPILALLEGLSKVINTVVSKIREVLDYVYPIIRGKVLEKLAGPLASIKEKLDAFKETKLKFFEDWLSAIENVDPTEAGEKIISFLRNVWDFLRKIKNGDFSGAFDIFSKKDATGEKKNPFASLTAYWEKTKPKLGPIGTFIDVVIGKVESFKKKVKELTSTGEVSTLSAIFQVLKNKFVSVLASLGIELPTFEEGVSKIGQAFEWLQGVFSNAYTAVKTWLTPTWEAIQKWFSDSGLDAGKLLAGGALTIIVSKLLDFFTVLGKAKTDGSVLNGLTSTLNPLTGMFDDLKKILADFSIIKFAIAMVLLAYALAKLGELGTSGMGVSLGTLAGSLVEFVITFAAMSKILGGKNGTKMIKVAAGMLVMTWALRSFAKVIEAYQKLRFESVKDVIKVLAVLFVAVNTFSRLAKVTGKFDFKFSNGMGLIALATALWLFGKVLNSYTKLKINSDNILKVLLGLLLAIVTISKIAKAAGNANFKFSNGMALIALTLSLLIFASAVKKLGRLDTGVLFKGGVAVAALGYVISLIVKNIAKSLENLKLRSAIGALLIMAGVTAMLIVLAGLCFVLGNIDSNVLGTGAFAVIVGLGLIVLAMHALCKSIENIKLGGAIGSLLMLAGMAAMLIVFAGAVVGLGLFGQKNPEAYLRGLIAVALIIGGFLAVAAVLKHASAAKLVVMSIGLIAAAASLYIAVLAIERLTKLDADKVFKGLAAVGLLLAGFLAMVALHTVATIIMVGELATVAFIKQLADALEPVITQLERLASMNSENTEKGLKNIKDVIDIFFDLAERLAKNAGLYGEAKQAADLAKIFGESLRPLCDDTAILGGTDPEAAAANLLVVKGLIQMILDLAELLTSNTELYGQATQAAELARLFGESLRPLCDDTTILGGADPENAAGSLLVVQGLIDTMLDLAGKLIQNMGLFAAGMAASTLARAFGEGLKGLCEDVVILGGNQSAETSLASVETVQALIDLMVGFASQLNDNAWLFEAGVSAATLAGNFGDGLKQLCEDTVILGDNNDASTSLASVATVSALITVMLGLAKKLNKNQEIYASAEKAAGVAGQFGKGLEQLCKDVELLGKANVSNVSGNLTLLLGVINTMMTIATAIEGNDDLYEAGVDTARLITKFGWSLVPLTGVAFALAKVNSGAAIEVDGEGNITGGGFQAIGAIIDYMLALAKRISEEDGLFEKAKSAAKMCKQFGEGLIWLTGEAFVAQFINPENSAQVNENGEVTGGGFQAVAAIIDYMVGLAEKFGPAGGLTFKLAESAADACKAFAGGLTGLIAETFALGFTNSIKASANFETIKSMVDYLVELAEKFKADSSLFDTAETMAGEGGVIRNFARALAGLVVNVILASFSEAENASASVAAMRDMVGMLIDLATVINDNSGMSASLESATTILKDFGDNMAYITAGVHELYYGQIDTDTLSGTLTAIEEFIEGVVGLEGDAKSAASVIKGIADMFQAAAQLSRDNAGKIFGKTEFQTGLGGVFDTITAGIEKILDLGDISQAAISLEGLGSIFEVLGDLLYLDYDDSEFGSAIETFVSDATNAISKAIDDMEMSMGEIDFSSFDIVVTSFMESTLESMNAFGNNIMVSISDGTIEGAEVLKVSLGLTMNDCVSVLKSYAMGGNSFSAAGRYAMIGFNNGFVSGAQIVYNNARIIANSVVNILKSALKIKSPSRVFAEIGEYAILGLAKGFEDTGYEAVNAIENLGNMVIDTMQRAMEYANSTELAFTPMVTPVVDMNNVSGQAASINSMIDGFNLRGLTANTNIDGATINNSIQSKDIVNEIRQLNERMAVMDANLQNMQIVLDTGILVGATSAKMDNQFGVMAARRGRGN